MTNSIIPYLFAWSLVSITIAIWLSIYVVKIAHQTKHRRIIGPITQKLQLRSKTHGGATFLGYCDIYYLDDEGEIRRRVIVKHPNTVLAHNIKDMIEKVPNKISNFYD